MANGILVFPCEKLLWAMSFMDILTGSYSSLLPPELCNLSVISRFTESTESSFFPYVAYSVFLVAYANVIMLAICHLKHFRDPFQVTCLHFKRSYLEETFNLCND